MSPKLEQELSMSFHASPSVALLIKICGYALVGVGRGFLADGEYAREFNSTGYRLADTEDSIFGDDAIRRLRDALTHVGLAVSKVEKERNGCIEEERFDEGRRLLWRLDQWIEEEGVLMPIIDRFPGDTARPDEVEDTRLHHPAVNAACVGKSLEEQFSAVDELLKAVSTARLILLGEMALRDRGLGPVFPEKVEAIGAGAAEPAANASGIGQR